MNRWALVMLIVAASSWHFGAIAQEGIPTVGDLTKHSEVIVVGMASLNETPSSSETSLTIRIDRAIKGSLATGTTISVVSMRTGSCMSTTHPFTSAYGLWFLKSVGDGQYDFIKSLRSQWCNQFVPRFELMEGQRSSQFAYDPKAPPEDKLAYELAAAFVSHEGDGPWAFIDDPFVLHGASNEALQDIYRKLEESQTPSIHMEGLLGLVNLGDPEALDRFEEHLQGITSTPVRSSGLVRGDRLPMRYGKNGDAHPTYESDFADAIRAMVNPGSIAVDKLGRLLSTSTPIVIRRAAAYALQNVHSAPAVEELAPLLADSDQEVRAYAIGGLACFANGSPPIGSTDGRFAGVDLSKPSQFKNKDTLDHFAMGVPTISQREDYYLQYWRQWWSLNAGSVSQLAAN